MLDSSVDKDEDVERSLDKYRQGKLPGGTDRNFVDDILVS